MRRASSGPAGTLNCPAPSGWRGHRCRRRSHGRHRHHAVVILLESRRVHKVFDPFRRDGFLRQRCGVIHLVVSHVAGIRLSVEEHAKVATRTPPPLEIPAKQSAEIARMIQLLFGAVRVRATWAQWATLGVRQTGILLVPIRAKLMPITNCWRSSHILVGVCVHASLPIMLCASRAP